MNNPKTISRPSDLMNDNVPTTKGEQEMLSNVYN